MALEWTDYIVLTVLGAWIALSVLGQFHARNVETLRQFDVFHLIPTWTFFAPNPGSTDYHIVCRDRSPGETVSSWTEVTLMSTRSLRTFVWNPEKRETKILHDIVTSIVEKIGRDRERDRPATFTEETLLLHGSYVLLLSIVLHRITPLPTATHRQFAIVERFGVRSNAPIRPILSSPFHAFSAESAVR